ncbi:MAG: hypothetical protein MK212_06835 [Saprospiraceae bacterium]|nr:hypothetical protein [Saprospiraceae bacterium]
MTQNNLLILLLSCVLGLSFSSCKQDLCEDIVCGEGNCDEGICICNDGYQLGTDNTCSVAWSTKFGGSNLSGTDLSSGDSGDKTVNYSMIIEPISPTRVVTRNLGGFNNQNFLELDIVSSNSLSFNTTDSKGRTFVGSGTLSEGILNLNYTVTHADATIDTCQSTITGF